MFHDLVYNKRRAERGRLVKYSAWIFEKWPSGNMLGNHVGLKTTMDSIRRELGIDVDQYKCKELNKT